MKIKTSCLAAIFISAVATESSRGATVLAIGTTTQDFNAIGSGLPTDWSVRTGATASSLGTAATLNTAKVSWGTATGEFRNVAASTGLTSGSTVTAQDSSTNRAVGLRQTAGFGDPGASFNFTFGTTDRAITAISIDLMLLSVQGRSTPFSIQYGIGANPSSFSTLGTYTDPGAFGSTNFAFDATDFGTNLNNQADVHFRVVALSASTGPNSRDTIAIDNFSINAVPEPSAALLGALGVLALLRRRR